MTCGTEAYNSTADASYLKRGEFECNSGMGDAQDEAEDSTYASVAAAVSGRCRRKERARDDSRGQGRFNHCQSHSHLLERLLGSGILKRRVRLLRR